MLTLSGFGAVSDDFMTCIADYPDDLDFCRTMYPVTPDVPNDPGYIEMPDDYVGGGSPPPTAGMQTVTTSQPSYASPANAATAGFSTRTIAIAVGLGLLGLLAYKRTRRA